MTMNFVIFMNCALLALLALASLVSSGEDDYDPCKAAAFVNGDIAITKYELLRMKRTRRAATSLMSRRWKHGIIAYEIDDVFTGDQKLLMLEAMRHWENNSCLTFVEHTTEKDFIFFQKGSCGCCSFVGRKGNGKQGISIGEDCDSFGIIVHELGHALGFWHEHTRPDRNQYVKIITRNIEKGKENNFAILNYDEVNSLGEKYDFGSIMHYAPNLFSKRITADVIIPKANISRALLASIGQRKHLSKGDVKQINKMYRCPKCGGTLQKQSGTISNSGNPSRNAVLNKCEWRIFSNPGEIIVLNVKRFRLKQNTNCETDYVEIRDGYGPNSSLIGKYCGNNKPPNEISSSGNRMLVRTRTRGVFFFNYRATCGGVIRLDKGKIQSPNYPLSYRYNKICNWNVIVKEGTKVGITFTSFDVEPEENCSYDALTIYDGLAHTDKSLGRFCGKVLPKDVVTSSNKALVKFESDNSVDGRGFQLNFFSEVDECLGNISGCAHNCHNTIGSFKCSCNPGYELHSNGKDCELACGGELKDKNGTITSPSYPDRYPKNKKCSWSIRAPPLHKIELRFKEFELEESHPGQGCYDYLVVKNKKNTTRLCGKRNPGVMMSTSNEMYIEFVSDNSMSMKGFKADYKTDKDECQDNNGGCEHDCADLVGGYLCKCQPGYKLHKDKHRCIEGGHRSVLTDPTGIITSPGYPDHYREGLRVRWSVIVTPGHRVKLTFQEFSLENDYSCSFDYVLVESGFKNAEKRLCGQMLDEEDKVYISRLNTMVIHFTTDSEHSAKGFKAVYETVCGGRLHADNDEQSIVSHVEYNLNKSYPANASCIWHLAAKDGYVIKITFETFELEDDGCSSDFLRIADGSDENAPTIARICGTQTGKEMQSTGNNMWLQFKTDESKAKKGFEIGYKRVKL